MYIVCVSGLVLLVPARGRCVNRQPRQKVPELSYHKKQCPGSGWGNHTILGGAMCLIANWIPWADRTIQAGWLSTDSMDRKVIVEFKFMCGLGGWSDVVTNANNLFAMVIKMMNILRSFVLLFFLLSLGVVVFHPASLQADTRGQVTGGVLHDAPNWFKESFLEIQDDVDEATEANRHVMLFFQLNGCPYCSRMLEESFEPDDKATFIQANFDAIAINVAGDREVVFNESLTVTEKELSEILEVRATPAIVFLNSDNQTVVRVNGYRAPERFKQVLDYVRDKQYEKQALAAYLEEHMPDAGYQFKDNALFTDTDDLSGISGPLAVIFEDSRCHDCNEFHNILAREDVQEVLGMFTIVRLDAASTTPMLDVAGNTTSPKALAEAHQMLYRPGVMLFDNGTLIRRHDSLLFPHHFKESLRYVGGGHHKTQPYDIYSQTRTEELLSQGIDINLGQQAVDQ